MHSKQDKVDDVNREVKILPTNKKTCSISTPTTVIEMRNGFDHLIGELDTDEE